MTSRAAAKDLLFLVSVEIWETLPLELLLLKLFRFNVHPIFLLMARFNVISIHLFTFAHILRNCFSQYNDQILIFLQPLVCNGQERLQINFIRESETVTILLANSFLIPLTWEINCNKPQLIDLYLLSV